MTKSCLFVILLILSSFFAVSAQSDALKNDLGNSFRNVSVVRLNTRDAARQAQASRNISIATSNKTFELSVTPRDLRAARYFAEDTTAVGVRRLEKTPVTTYKGKIVGEAQSEVRLTIDDSGVEGYFLEGAERYFIEPAKNYSKLASADEFIVYKAEDVLKDTSFSCPQDLSGKLEDGKMMVSSGSVQSLNGLKTIEIATEADFDYVSTTNNSASAANANILSILNMVEGVYENDVNLTVSVVYQHTWSTADPYTGTNASLLLSSFQSYWNTNYPLTQYPRDVAHLFTDKPNVRSQGFAYLGVICNNPSFAYGMSGRINVAGLEAANFLVTAHEIGHNLGATHSDSYANCVDSLMNIQISQYTQPTFCSASRSEVSNFVSANGVCLTGRNFGRLDFDGDGKTDIGIFRPSSGEWWINGSSTSRTTASRFGISSDKIASGDFTGDGKADIAFFRPSTGFWFILRSEDNSFFSFPFGTIGDIPAPADYDGDGKTDAAVFRPSSNTWFILQSGGGTGIITFGAAGDVPVTADYDGDGKSDIAIFRPSDGSWWYVRSSDSQYRVFRFGVSTDKPVQGDYTGDGKADIAIFRPSTGFWFILRSEDSSFYSVPFGASGDVPSPGDYDGDGKFDTAVFRPASNTWFINQTTAGTAILTFGVSGDNPIPNAFVP
jgi:hypothetical protein